MQERRPLDKGLETARFYHSTQKYFFSITRLLEDAAVWLIDQGWQVSYQSYGQRTFVESYHWVHDRCILPKRFGIIFNRDYGTTKYGLSIWFFTSDPDGYEKWVPSAYFYRIELLENGIFKDWEVDLKFAKAANAKLLHHTVDSLFLNYTKPWEPPINGDNIDGQFESVSIVPFPLACIETNEQLILVTRVAVDALELNSAEILRKNDQYLELTLGRPMLLPNNES